jgi:hypothetical protein
VAADLSGAAFAHLMLEPRAAVDDLAANVVAVELQPNGDLALAMRDGVGNELREDELECSQPIGAELVAERAPRCQASLRDKGRVRLERELERLDHEHPCAAAAGPVRQDVLAHATSRYPTGGRATGGHGFGDALHDRLAAGAPGGCDEVLPRSPAAHIRYGAGRLERPDLR